MSNSPLVSAIVSTHNAEQFIRGRLENLLQQSIASTIEIIVIVSGSEQHEAAIVQQYALQNKNVSLIVTQKRETIFAAWNRGIKMSKGEFITNANADDRLVPNALEILTNALRDDPQSFVAYANQELTSDPSVALARSHRLGKVVRPTYSPLRLLAGDIVGPQPLWRASLHWEENIWFNESYEVSGDYDFFCHVSENHQLLHIPRILGLCYHSPHKANREFQDVELTAAETAQIQLKYTERFISSMHSSERIRLKRRLRRYLFMPTLLHTAVFRISKYLIPTRHLLPRGFVCVLAALLYQFEGDLGRAVEICQRASQLARATTARMLLGQLLRRDRVVA
jgi:glycosyltransferase involved in cell wall biosynthesis